MPNIMNRFSGASLHHMQILLTELKSFKRKQMNYWKKNKKRTTLEIKHEAYKMM